MASNGITMVDCCKIITESLEHWEKYRVGSWAVERDDTIVGWAGFKNYQKNEFELLIVLGTDSWGIGKKVYTALITLAKDEFKLNSLITGPVDWCYLKIIF